MRTRRRRVSTRKPQQTSPSAPNVEVDQVVAISDVTARVNVAGLAGKALVDAKRAIEATIAKECSCGDAKSTVA
jgi:hypothetical protein